MSRRDRWAAVALMVALLPAALSSAGVPPGQAARRAADLATDTPFPTATVFADLATNTAVPTATAFAPLPTQTLVPSFTPTSTQTASTTPSVTVTVPPTATPSVTATAPPTNTPLPTATPRPLSFGALDHAIVYDDGREIYLIHPDGSGRVGLAFLSPGPHAFKPRFGGYQYIYYNNGFFLGDIFGHQTPITPPLGGGEQVYDAWPSPDGQYIAWQFVTPAAIGQRIVNMGSSRIVITDPTGGNARVLLQQPADAAYGGIPIVYGWRAVRPATLLVQSSYAGDALFGLRKGLMEFDPGIDDLVGDYLPPVGADTLPGGEVLGISPRGFTLIYATRDALLPSGEGPFPVAISSLGMARRQVAAIDVATDHRDGPVGKLPAPRAYIFDRGAYVSPDDTRMAYTRLDILYPKGALRPYVRPVACLANLDGSGKADFGPNDRVLGWTDGHTVLVRREDTRENGLYTVDLTTARATRILLGNGLRVDGIVP